MLIPDKNFKLALIDQIYSQKSRESLYGLDKEYEAFRQIHDGLAIEEMGIEPQLNTEIENFILALPIDETALLEITSLTLDGDREAYAIIFPYWWDFGDHFVINNLEGIQYCKNLQTLNLGQGLVNNASIKPLLNLSQLEKLSLSAISNYKDIDELAELNIKEIAIYNLYPKDKGKWADTLDKVKAKNVILKII